MLQKKKLQYFEITLYVFVGLITFLVPVFMYYSDSHDRGFLFRDWLRLLPFIAIFLVNNFVLLPKFFFKKKYTTYFILSIALIAVVVTLSSFCITSKRHFGRDQAHRPIANKEMVTQAHHFDLPNAANRPMQGRPLPQPLIFNFGMFIIGLFVIGFNSGIKIFAKWTEEQEQQASKERQYLAAELAFLRHQISPHFFMNTLNNIHALIDIDSEKAKDSIIKLSKLMRHLLYETDEESTSLQKEITFLESYIELMRLRYDENKLSIKLSYPKPLVAINVPTLLFLPLVENAFKHGVGTGVDSFIDISFEVKDKQLNLVVKNSNFAQEATTFSEKSGIGLKNIHKRLEILYKDRYRLDINDTSDTFCISLLIPCSVES